MTSRASMLGLLLGLSWLLFVPVQAHTLSLSHLDIQVPATGEPMRVELDLALRDLALTLPLDANRDEIVTWGELTAVRDQIEALVASGLKLPQGAHGFPWKSLSV